jgi:hypothetical protein
VALKARVNGVVVCLASGELWEGKLRTGAGGDSILGTDPEVTTIVVVAWAMQAK